MLHLCRDLIALRRETPDLRSGAYASMPSPAGVWAWRRGDGTVVAVNLSEEPVTVPSARARSRSAPIALATARRSRATQPRAVGGRGALRVARPPASRRISTQVVGHTDARERQDGASSRATSVTVRTVTNAQAETIAIASARALPGAIEIRAHRRDPPRPHAGDEPGDGIGRDRGHRDAHDEAQEHRPDRRPGGTRVLGQEREREEDERDEAQPERDPGTGARARARVVRGDRDEPDEQPPVGRHQQERREQDGPPHLPGRQRLGPGAGRSPRPGHPEISP